MTHFQNQFLMRRSIQLQTTYAHPIEKVWFALTNAEAMSQWLMPCDIKAEIGHKFKFTTKAYGSFDGIVHCEILEVLPQEKLVFSWSGGGLKNTVVSFQLKSLGDQTILYFEHNGFEGIMNRLIARNILARGWKKELLTVKLPDFLAQHQSV